MGILNSLWKRSLLAVLAVVVAMSWGRTGHAQAPCLVERGLDPLDVLQSGLRHNVWVMLDTSGSMNNTFSNNTGSDSKLEVAQAVINRLMDEIVDGAGQPLVNWAFVPYDRQVKNGNKCAATDDADDLDIFPDEPDGCHGLRDTAFVNPAICGEDSRQAVRDQLNNLAAGGGTPIGVAFTDMAEYIVGQHDPSGAASPNTTNFVDGLLPGQKNFIIHVTDGQDTCECNQGGYPPVVGDPLESAVTMRPNQADPFVTVSSTDGADRASYNAGLKGDVALATVDPALDGSKGNVFVIGMDLDAGDKEKINTIAWMSSGALRAGRDRALMNPAFFADSPEALVEAFEDIFARIGLPESEVTLGTSIVSSVKETIATVTNPAVNGLEVIGQVGPANPDAEQVRQAREIRASHQNNMVFVSTVDIPDFQGHLRAVNAYTVSNPDEPRTERDPDLTEIWDAGEVLQDVSPNSRNLWFNRRGSPTLLPFDINNVEPEDLGVKQGYLKQVDGIGARSDDDARTIVVQVIRGYRLSVDPATNTIYDADDKLNFSEYELDGVTKTWKLFENISGTVAVVSNPPRSPDFDPPLNHASKYGVGGTTVDDGFYWKHFNRRTMVYYPSNAGILEAFDAATGEEIFGYLPDDVLGLAPNEVVGSRDTLADLVRLLVIGKNSIINHVFTLAGAPTVADAFLRSDSGGDDDWHTLLTFGRGRGGRALTALDVTDPQSPSLRWNVVNREGVVQGDLDGLGETWSIPVLGNVNTIIGPDPDGDEVDQWLVFAGGGYGCDNTEDEGQYLFAFRAENGEIYQRAQVSNDGSAPVSYNALPAMPTLYNAHETDLSDNKDYISRVYIPDVQGRVWKWNVSDADRFNWDFGMFADLGSEHAMTAPVTVLKDNFVANRVIVMAGSGGDRRAPVPPGEFKFFMLNDLDASGANTLQFNPGDTPFSERAFLPNERMFTQAVTFGKLGQIEPPLAVFASTLENLDVAQCELTYSSTLYGELVKSGSGEFDLDTGSPGTTANIADRKISGIIARDQTLYVSEAGSLGTDGKVSIWGDTENPFGDTAPSGGIGSFLVQVLVEGFRISPF